VKYSIFLIFIEFKHYFNDENSVFYHKIISYMEGSAFINTKLWRQSFSVAFPVGDWEREKREN
jgi:hypothetical protein